MQTEQEWRSKRHHLPAHLYSQPGVFFITICTRNRKHSFGSISESTFVPSSLGRIVEETWLSLPRFHPCATLDSYAIMPNHFHGILSTLRTVSTSSYQLESLPKLVSAFKGSVTRVARQRGLAGQDSVWQGDYWDHIIRHEGALQRIREYIANNPLAWAIDEENSDRVETNEFYVWLRVYGRKVLSQAQL